MPEARVRAPLLSDPRTPCLRMMEAAGLRAPDVAALAPCSVDTVLKLRRGQWDRLKLGDVARIARVLGCAPVDLIPGFECPMPRIRVHEQRARAREARGMTTLKPRESEAKGRVLVEGDMAAE